MSETVDQKKPFVFSPAPRWRRWLHERSLNFAPQLSNLKSLVLLTTVQL